MDASILKQQNLKKMQGDGLATLCKEIYNQSEGAVGDAVVQFGGGCTGEIMSAPKGLSLPTTTVVMVIYKIIVA